jgi:hypothetical protein
MARQFKASEPSGPHEKEKGQFRELRCLSISARSRASSASEVTADEPPETLEPSPKRAFATPEKADRAKTPTKSQSETTKRQVKAIIEVETAITIKRNFSDIKECSKKDQKLQDQERQVAAPRSSIA